MAIHELATNAAKYGALSNATGRMHLTWQPSETPGRMKLVWREAGGPPVTKPENQGFGLRLVGGALESELRTQLDFNRDGVVCTFDVAL
jgi:two-component sensor histidine kinase